MFSYAPVILFTGGCGRCPQADTPPGQNPLGGHPLGGHPLSRHPPVRHPLGRQPLGRHPPGTATAANGTHPTGMHSCLAKMKEIGLRGGTRLLRFFRHVTVSQSCSSTSHQYKHLPLHLLDHGSTIITNMPQRQLSL